MSAPKLTEARRAALEVLEQGPARYSNATEHHQPPVSGLAGTVYWQSADWLLENRLAAMQSCPPHGECLVITAAGRELLEAAA